MMKTSVKFHVKVASLLTMKMKMPSAKLYFTENETPLSSSFQELRCFSRRDVLARERLKVILVLASDSLHVTTSRELDTWTYYPGLYSGTIRGP